MNNVIVYYMLPNYMQIYFSLDFVGDLTKILLNGMKIPPFIFYFTGV